MARPAEALPLDGETIRHGRDLGVPVDEAFTAIEMAMLVDRAVRRSGPHQGRGSGSSRAADPIIGPPEVLYRPVGDWRRTNRTTSRTVFRHRPTRRGIALVLLARFICPRTVLSSSNLPGEQEENQGAVEMQLDCEFTWAPRPGRAAPGDDLGPLTKDNTGQVLGFAQATGRTS